MSSVRRFRQYAADCVRQAQAEETIEDRTILLNVALAWLRLARQVEDSQAASPPTAPDHEQAAPIAPEYEDAEPTGDSRHHMTF